MADQDDLDLRTLGDDELVEQMHDDLYDGLADEITDGVNILIDQGGGQLLVPQKRSPFGEP